MDLAGFSLLEVLSTSARCQYLSDLHSLSPWDRLHLAQAIEDIPSNAASLAQWNDALDYILGEPSQSSPQTARNRLRHLLSQF